MALKKAGYSPIDQYTKMYTTTPGIKVVIVPMASKSHPHVIKVNNTLIMNTIVILKMYTPKHYIKLPETHKALVIGYNSHPAILYNMTVKINHDTNIGIMTLTRSIYKNGKISPINTVTIKFNSKTHEILSTTTSGDRIQPQGFWCHIACEIVCHALLAGGIAACCAAVPELCAACMALVDTSSLAVCYAACLKICD